MHNKNELLRLNFQIEYNIITMINLIGLIYVLITLFAVIVASQSEYIERILYIYVVLSILIFIFNIVYCVVIVILSRFHNVFSDIIDKHPTLTMYIFALYFMLFFSNKIFQDISENKESIMLLDIALCTIIILITSFTMVITKVEIKTKLNHFLTLTVLVMNVYYYGLFIITLDAYNICYKLNLRAENYRMFLIVPILIFGYIYKECFIITEEGTKNSNFIN